MSDASPVRGLAAVVVKLRELADAVAALSSTDVAGGAELYYSYPEAAERLRVPEEWLHRNIGRLPHRKFGRTVRFTDKDLAAIAERFKATPPEPAPPTPPMASGPIPLSEIITSREARRRRAIAAAADAQRPS